MRKLYKFHWGYYRGGNVSGIFAAEESEVQAAMNKDVYFGEILGKHSEVSGVLEAEDLTELTDDQEFIAKAEALGVVPNGYDPLDYVREEEEEEEGEGE